MVRLGGIYRYEPTTIRHDGVPLYLVDHLECGHGKQRWDSHDHADGLGRANRYDLERPADSGLQIGGRKKFLYFGVLK